MLLLHYMMQLRIATVASGVMMAASIPMNAVNFEGGLRLVVLGNPASLKPQELLLDTGSSTLAFCDSSLAKTLAAAKTEYLSCNKYGSGNEGYWGPFYKGSVELGTDVSLEESYYSIMQQEVSMPCGQGLQGIFGVAFKQLDQAADHPGPLQWPAGGVGTCPAPSTTLVGPLMHYLKQDTPQGRLGIYWSGQLGASQGDLFVGPTAVSNSHYKQGPVLQAQLGETGYYDITIQQFSFGGQKYPVSCNQFSPCLMDTGTPIMMVPMEVYQKMAGGEAGSLSVQMAGPSDTSVSLEFDAATLVRLNYVAPYQSGEPYILGLPLWATYYTVFNVAKQTVDFVKHSSEELQAFKDYNNTQATVVV